MTSMLAEAAQWATENTDPEDSMGLLVPWVKQDLRQQLLARVERTMKDDLVEGAGDKPTYLFTPEKFAQQASNSLVGAFAYGYAMCGNVGGAFDLIKDVELETLTEERYYEIVPMVIDSVNQTVDHLCSMDMGFVTQVLQPALVQSLNLAFLLELPGSMESGVFVDTEAILDVYHRVAIRAFNGGAHVYQRMEEMTES